MNIFTLFKNSLSLWTRDKWVLFFSLIPVLLGILLFGLVGNYIFTDLAEMGRTYIESSLSSNTWGGILYYLLLGIFTIAFFFVLNYGFVLVVSLFACPFNDIISHRVEKMLLGEEMPSPGKTFERLFSRIVFTLFNETKKIIVIMTFTIIVFFMSLFPLLSPLGFFLSALLMAASFLDYSWSRHDLNLRECIGDLKEKLFNNFLGGALFIIFVSIPVVNLLALPFGVIFFTNLFVEKNKYGRETN